MKFLRSTDDFLSKQWYNGRSEWNLSGRKYPLGTLARKVHLCGVYFNIFGRLDECMLTSRKIAHP